MEGKKSRFWRINKYTNIQLITHLINHSIRSPRSKSTQMKHCLNTNDEHVMNKNEEFIIKNEHMADAFSIAICHGMMIEKSI